MSPVPEKFQAYGEAVCAFLSHATRREKAAVRQELMDHLTDHTQALLDAGCPPEAAETRALAAMGEAQEVGQALNQAFPGGGWSSPGWPWPPWGFSLPWS